jgi:hypothetical protein
MSEDDHAFVVGLGWADSNLAESSGAGEPPGATDDQVAPDKATGLGIEFHDDQ